MEQTKPNNSMLQHLSELRKRLIRCLAAVFLVFIILFYFANDLYHLLAIPLLNHLPAGSNLIATGVASPFLAPFKLTLALAFFISVPIILHQAWSFIAPALYRHEKKMVVPILSSSTLLFYLGMVFAYFVVFPLVFGFFASVTPKDVTFLPDISQYLNFSLKLFIAFGIAFEVPIITVLLIWSGITSRKKLARKRPYIVIAAFVTGMLLTPPDVLSQVLLAIPIWLLFEAGLLLSRLKK